MAAKPAWFTENLVLGWKVTKGLEPLHWFDNGKPGKHKLTDVVVTDPKTIAHHTIIVAQSGSGKSFFLGRLIEEILLKTRGRVLVLDMNSDFRKIAEAKDDSKWTDKRYDRTKRGGFLAEEPTKKDFTSQWDEVSKVVYSKPRPGNVKSEPLLLDWLNFPIELLAEDAPENERDELRHCHDLIKILADLTEVTNNEKWLKSFLACAQGFCEAATKDGADIQATLCAEFGDIESGSEARELPKSLAAGNIRYVYVQRKFPTLANMFSPGRGRFYQRVLTHCKFISKDSVRVYFSRAVELEQSGVIDPNVVEAHQVKEPRRIEVVDLPSLRDPRHQKMAISAFLEAAWQRAKSEWEQALANTADKDSRVPTFIVVEEAHNAVPVDAVTPAEIKLKEQFRRIAAEGRKYGLFLILVSQRPDKLDRMVMSECENRAVMKVGSTVVLRTTCEALALDGIVSRLTEKVLDFDLGRALLAGPWVSDEPTFMVSAARRTEEGGRNLREDIWAKLPVSPFNPAP